MDPEKILVYGYGNPGRQDDALGSRVARWCETAVEEGILPPISIDTNYQLNVEDALLLSEHDFVIFADASVEDSSGYRFARVVPEKTIAFSTHAMNPSSILALCRELYGKEPQTYLMSIRGYGWELGAPLSRGAERNLEEALIFLRYMLLERISEK